MSVVLCRKHPFFALVHVRKAGLWSSGNGTIKYAPTVMSIAALASVLLYCSSHACPFFLFSLSLLVHSLLFCRRYVSGPTKNKRLGATFAFFCELRL